MLSGVTHCMEYYVYIYVDPTKPGKFVYDGIDYAFDYEPFYVGKGKNSRYKCHFKKSEREANYNPLKNETFSKIESFGFNPLDFVIMFRINMSESESFIWELLLISKIGRKDLGIGPLVNLTDGGEGPSGCVSKRRGKTYEEIHGVELAQKMRDIRRERFIGDKNPMFGKSSGMKGKKMSEESRAKLSSSKSKPIIQMDLDSNFIKEWSSVREASEVLGIHQSSLNNCLSLNYRAKTAGGFKWEYKDRKNPQYSQIRYRKNQKFYKIINIQSGEEFYSLNLQKFCIGRGILPAGLFQTVYGNYKQSKGYRAFLITKEEYEAFSIAPKP